MLAKRLSLVGILFFALPGGFLSTARATDEPTFDLETTTLVFAEEIFGARPAEETLGSAADPPLSVTLTMLDGAVQSDSQGRFIFRLPANDLGGNVETGTRQNLQDLTVTGSDGTEFPLAVASAGALGAGNTELSWTLRTFQDGNANDPRQLLPGTTISFPILSLQNLGNLRVGSQVRLSVAVQQTRGNFPNIDPLTDGVGGNTVTNDVLVEVANKITLRGLQTRHRGGFIDPLEPNRFSSNAFEITVADGSTRQAIGLGVLEIDAEAVAAMGPDGLTEFALTADDMITITVEGDDLSAYEFGLFDYDLDAVADPDEIVSIENGLTFSAISPAATALLTTSSLICLVADGETAIAASTLRATINLDYADATYLDEESASTPDTEARLTQRQVRFNLSMTTLRLAEEVLGAPDRANTAFGGDLVATLDVTDGQVNSNQQATLVWRLVGGAGFGADLTADNLEISGLTSGTSVNKTLMSGGRAGDSSVAFRLETGPTDADTLVLTAANSITLTIPGLRLPENAEDGDEFRVVVELDADTAGEEPAPGFFYDLLPLTADDGNLITNDVLLEVVDAVVLRAVNEVELLTLNPEMPSRFEESEHVFDFRQAGLELQAVRLGFVGITLADPAPSLADGTTAFALTTDDRLDFTVNGPQLDDYFYTFIDRNDNQLPDTNENFFEDNDENSFILAGLNGDHALVTELQMAALPVYLVTDSETELEPGSYSITMLLNLAEAAYQDESVTSPEVRFLRAGFAESDVRFQLETTPWNLATELFGERRREPTLPGERTVTLQVRDSTGISRGASGTIGYRLDAGAEFGERALRAASLRLERNTRNPNSDVRVALLSGGQVGDNQAVFRVTSGQLGDPEAPALSSMDRLVLTVPGIQRLSGRRVGDEIRVQVTVIPDTVVDGFNFPTLEPLKDGEDGNLIMSDALVRVGRKFTLVAEGSGVMPTVNVADRTEFSAGALLINLPGGDRVQGIQLGSLGVSRSDLRFPDASGGEDLALGPGDRLRITVTGSNFNAGARAFIDLNENSALDEAEIVPLAGGAVFPATEPEAMALLARRRTLYLLTDGEAKLEPGNYMAQMTLDFADIRYLDSSVVTPTVTTMLGGIQRRGFAYAVPNCTQVEQAGIHIVNETHQPLNLFLQGVDQAGRELGLAELDASLLRGGGGATLQPGEALDLLTGQVEELFNLEAGSLGGRCTAVGTWQGRAQLTFFANGNITILPQLRGSLGELRDLGGFTGLELGDEVID